jgi:hypothetical protein
MLRLLVQCIYAVETKVLDYGMKSFWLELSEERMLSASRVETTCHVVGDVTGFPIRSRETRQFVYFSHLTISLKISRPSSTASGTTSRTFHEETQVLGSPVVIMTKIDSNCYLRTLPDRNTVLLHDCKRESSSRHPST